MPLARLVRDVKEAARNRTDATGGRIGVDASRSRCWSSTPTGYVTATRRWARCTKGTKPVVSPVVVPGVPLNLNVAVSESWVVSWSPPDRGGEAHWYRLELCFASRREEFFTSDRAVNIAGHVSDHVGENLDLRVKAENINSMHGEWTDTPAYTNITSGVPATLTTTQLTISS